jgi:hypothetical protein
MCRCSGENDRVACLTESEKCQIDTIFESVRGFIAISVRLLPLVRRSLDQLDARLP